MRLVTASLFTGLIIVTDGFAQERCNLRCQADLRRQTLVELTIELDTEIPGLVQFSFDSSKFTATTYGGKRPREVNYPSYTGLAWLLEIPTDSRGRIISIRHRLFSLAKQPEGRYALAGDYLLDLEEGREIRVESTVDFFENNREFFDSASSSGIVVSGPFWKQEEWGERPLGLLLLEDEGLVQPMANFSARHVLCLKRSGVDLFSVEKVMRESNVKRFEDVAELIGKRVVSVCKNAIQVGPAYFEQRIGKESDNQVGIAGISIGEQRRNILLRLGRPGDEAGKIFLFTTMSNVSPFDAMVVIEAISEKLSGENSILWAVGLQDAEFLSGPLIVDGGRTIRLNSTNLPTGALLLFEYE